MIFSPEFRLPLMNRPQRAKDRRKLLESALQNRAEIMRLITRGGALESKPKVTNK